MLNLRSSSSRIGFQTACPNQKTSVLNFYSHQSKILKPSAQILVSNSISKISISSTTTTTTSLLSSSSYSYSSSKNKLEPSQMKKRKQALYSVSASPSFHSRRILLSKSKLALRAGGGHGSFVDMSHPHVYNSRVSLDHINRVEEFLIDPSSSHVPTIDPITFKPKYPKFAQQQLDEAMEVMEKRPVHEREIPAEESPYFGPLPKTDYKVCQRPSKNKQKKKKKLEKKNNYSNLLSIPLSLPPPSNSINFNFFVLLI